MCSTGTARLTQALVLHCSIRADRAISPGIPHLWQHLNLKTICHISRFTHKPLLWNNCWTVFTQRKHPSKINRMMKKGFGLNKDKNQVDMPGPVCCTQVRLLPELFCWASVPGQALLAGVSPPLGLSAGFQLGSLWLGQLWARGESLREALWFSPQPFPDGWATSPEGDSSATSASVLEPLLAPASAKQSEDRGRTICNPPSLWEQTASDGLMQWVFLLGKCWSKWAW